MEGTKPRTASSIGMFDMLKGAGMLTIVFAHTAELYPMQAVSGLSLTAFFPFIYREALMAAFFIASGYGFRKRSIHKCIHQQLKSLLKPYAYTALFTCVLHFIIHYKTFQYLPGTIGESIKVTGGFLLGLPHTAEYFGQEFFSCGPMWYLLALMVGWVLLDVILNIFPERYVPWAVAGCVLLGWGASLVWELPFCLIQGAVVVPYLYRLPCQKEASAGRAPAAQSLCRAAGRHSTHCRRRSCYPHHRLHLAGRVVTGAAEHLSGRCCRPAFHPAVHAAQPWPWPHRALSGSGGPPFAEHFLRTYRGDHRYSVVSDGSKVLCAAGAGHVAAICHRSGLYLAGV